MEEHRTILCVDDEENVLHALRRLLRKEGYHILTSSTGSEAFEYLRENNVQVVICDQRMLHMSGVDFLSQVKELSPDTIQIVLTGYTDIDSITEAINQGQIYKFLLKPWNDQNLKIEIKKAFDQYELIQANKKLHQKILKQNEELRTVNEHLEELVKERTKVLEIQNQALELSRAILEDLPIPIVGVSEEKMIVLLNQKAQSIQIMKKSLAIGSNIREYFDENLEKKIEQIMTNNQKDRLLGCSFDGIKYNLDLIPLSGRFQGKGLIVVLQRPE